MLAEVVSGVWRAREKRETLQVYVPLCEALRMLNSSGKELAVGGPTVTSLPLTTLLPSESNQSNIGVLWIPSTVVTEHRMSYMFPAIGFPIGTTDTVRDVAGTAIRK